MSENFICLNCLVQGENLYHIFLVQLSSLTNVVDLREVIKDKKKYAFPADQLVLHHTSEQVTNWCDNDADGLLQAVREGNHTKLLPSCPLSAVFNQPLTSNGLHVLVGLPSDLAVPSAPPATLCLNCLALGDTRDHIFSVEISGSKNISFLKKAIKDEVRQTFFNVDANQLGLYCVSLPNDSKLEDELEGYLHVVVQPPPRELEEAFTDKEGACIDEEEEDTMMAMNALTRLTFTPLKNPPSAMAKSGRYFSHQGGIRKILDGRCIAEGYDAVGPPIQLFNPAFAYFTSKAFDPDLAVPPAYMTNVYDLVDSSAVIYHSEVQRRDFLKPIIQKLTGHSTIFTQNADGTAPDGMVLVPQEHKGFVHLVVYEEKKEFGDGGADPSTQAAFSYWHIFTQKDAAIHTFRLATCCPVFIIAHAGPWLAILGGIITTRCIVQRLSDYLWLPLHSTHDDDHWLRTQSVHRTPTSVV